MSEELIHTTAVTLRELLPGDINHRSSVQLAEAALTIFEQAHAPTGDEREALANLIDDELQSQRIFDLRDIASAILAAGFRRTVQGEPTDAQVEAFVTAINAEGFVLDRRAVKAGLRAAAEGTGQPTNHEIRRQER